MVFERMEIQRRDMGVSKMGGNPPKMDGVFHGKPYEQMDDLGGFYPLFLVQHPHEVEKILSSLGSWTEFGNNGRPGSPDLPEPDRETLFSPKKYWASRRVSDLIQILSHGPGVAAWCRPFVRRSGWILCKAGNFYGVAAVTTHTLECRAGS